jgi:hypothetical protein
MLTCKGSEQQDGSSDYAFPETENRSLAGSSIAQNRKANRDCKKEDPEHGEAIRGFSRSSMAFTSATSLGERRKRGRWSPALLT